MIAVKDVKIRNGDVALNRVIRNDDSFRKDVNKVVMNECDMSVSGAYRVDLFGLLIVKSLIRTGVNAKV